jgi:hypothetical protein
MIHPSTELRFINDHIGYGVFATEFIPRGTITWVQDPFDQVFSPAEVSQLSAFHQSILDKYAFADARGSSVLCWDLGRFVNHSCAPAALSPGYNFEIAVRDIAPDDELTDDYGTLNLDAPFACSCSMPECRRAVGPEDAVRFADRWDQLVSEAFPLISTVQQPMWHLVREKSDVFKALENNTPIASCRENFRCFQAGVTDAPVSSDMAVA